MNTNAEQFQNQEFINLETYYTSGKGVKTPVWFVQEDDTLWVRTVAGSHKVRRLQATPRVSVVPSDRSGRPLGQWVPGKGEEILDQATQERVNDLFNKKYGLQKKAFDAMGRAQGHQSATLRIQVLPEPALQDA